MPLFAGTILFGHIVTFGGACGVHNPGFRADANSVLTLPEGFNFIKMNEHYISLWAKDDINTSVALNFQVGFLGGGRYVGSGAEGRERGSG